VKGLWNGNCLQYLYIPKNIGQVEPLISGSIWIKSEYALTHILLWWWPWPDSNWVINRCRTNLCRCRTVWSFWRRAAHRRPQTTTVSPSTSTAAATPANGHRRRRCRSWWRARRTCASGSVPRRRRPRSWRSSNLWSTTSIARPRDRPARPWVCHLGGRTPSRRTRGRRPDRGKRVRRTLRALRPARAAAVPAGRRRWRSPCPVRRPPSTRGAATVGWTGPATRAKTTTPGTRGPPPPFRFRAGPPVWGVQSPPCAGYKSAVTTTAVILTRYDDCAMLCTTDATVTRANANCGRGRVRAASGD